MIFSPKSLTNLDVLTIEKINYDLDRRVLIID